VPGASVDELRDACLRELSGWIVVAPVDLANALLDAGATKRRHARLMTHDLRALPPDVDQRVVPLSATAAELEPAYRAAYRPEHPDYAVASGPDPLGRLLSGELVGPLLGASRMAVVDGRIAGAAVVNLFPGAPPVAGPWLTELFRDPAVPGIGRELLRGAVAAAAADGLAALGLAVTHGNPAIGLYEDEGFRTLREDISVVLK
jgi:GNAT superfamily N-acetyltransferase